MGWGEPRSVSADLVRRNALKAAGDKLCIVVAAFLSSGTTGNRERMSLALDEYRTARDSALTEVQ